MRLAICVDGVDDESLIEQAVWWATLFEAVEVWCAYTGEAEREVREQWLRHGRRPPPPHGRRGGEDMDREQAEAIAARAVTFLEKAGIQAQPRTLAGRDAGHAVAAATGEGLACLVAAGHREGYGPHAIGHVARFIIDHARGPVIVIRLPAGSS
jgi:nucleotide-binding universal stress UspA family protein